MKKIVNFFKTHKNAKHVILGIVIFLTIIFSGFIYGNDNVFNNQLPIRNAVLQYLYSSIPNILTSYFILNGVGYLNYGLHYALTKAFNQNQRSETILKMLHSFTKYGLAILAILLILTVWGVNSAALITSAGGLALVVGLGAQSLISDVLAGIFIVFEGEFNVGDIVIIDNYRGKVLSIGIRTTKIRDIYGDIKTINNAQITTVINKTKELSMADVVVGINYGESLEKVEKIFKKEVKFIKDKIPETEEEVVYLGVQDLNASSVDLLFITYCKEEHVLAVKRKMRRELKLIFDRYNIEIPYQHITLEPRENGFESNVIVDDEDDDNLDQDMDFENLLFNKAIPDKKSVIQKQEKQIVEEEELSNINKSSNIDEVIVLEKETVEKNPLDEEFEEIK